MQERKKTNLFPFENFAFFLSSFLPHFGILLLCLQRKVHSHCLRGSSKSTQIEKGMLSVAATRGTRRLRHLLLPNLAQTRGLIIPSLADPRAQEPFDVVVIGGGHAGCEAAAAAARAGARTVLVTQKISTIGEMSCNPSFGGVGKGTLVREVDALDGLVGRVADKAGINFHVLNESKGPAAWVRIYADYPQLSCFRPAFSPFHFSSVEQGPRCQADRVLYKKHMLEMLSSYPNLDILEAGVEDLTFQENSLNGIPVVSGVMLASGQVLATKKAVITTGTFLSGEIHIGWILLFSFSSSSQLD